MGSVPIRGKGSLSICFAKKQSLLPFIPWYGSSELSEGSDIKKKNTTLYFKKLFDFLALVASWEKNGKLFVLSRATCAYSTVRWPYADVGLCVQLIATGNEDDSLSLLSC